MNDAKAREMGPLLALGLTFMAGLGLRALVALEASLRAHANGSDLAMELPHVVTDPINLGLAQVASFGATLGLGLALSKGGGRARDDLALVSVPAPAVALLLLIGVALQLPLSELGNLLAEVWPPSLAEQLARRDLLEGAGIAHGVGVVLALVLVAPVSEELLFRGLILRALSARHGARAGLVLSAILFGAMHTGSSMLPATVAGLVLGAIALRTGSTLASMLVHAAVNAVPVLITERLWPLRGFNVVSEAVYHLPALLVVGSAALALGGGYALFVWTEKDRNDEPD